MSKQTQRVSLGEELFFSILEGMDTLDNEEKVPDWGVPENLTGAFRAFLHEYVEPQIGATGDVFFNADDITGGVREKINQVFAPIAKRLSKEYNITIDVVIEPFYDDWSSVYFLTKGPVDFVIYENIWKTCHPLFDMEKEDTLKAIEGIYRDAEDKLKRCLVLTR